MPSQPLPDFVEDEHLLELDLSAQTLRGVHLQGCRLEGCSLVGATLTDCILERCTVVSCDLSNARLSGTSLHEVDFVDCKLQGVDFTAGGLAFSASFHGCNLSWTSFEAMRLSGLRATHCNLTEASFARARLDRADLRGSVLSGVDFGRADLRRADLRECTGLVLSPGSAKLKGTRIDLEAGLEMLAGMGLRVS